MCNLLWVFPLLKKDEPIISWTQRLIYAPPLFAKKNPNIILCVKGYKNKIRKSEKLNVDWLYQDTMIKNELVLIQRVSLFNSFVWKYILNLPFF